MIGDRIQLLYEQLNARVLQCGFVMLLGNSQVASVDFVGVKHCGDKSIANASNLDTAMLHPFSLKIC